MPKVDTDKFIVLLIEAYCRRMGIDRTMVNTILDDVLEKMGFKVENGNIVEIKPAAPEVLTVFNEILDRKLTDYPLSVRTLNCLKANGIETMRDLVRLQKTDWLKFRTSDKKSLTELDEFIKDHDLECGMNI